MLCKRPLNCSMSSVLIYTTSRLGKSSSQDPVKIFHYVEGGVEGRLDVLEDVALVADDLKEKQTLEILGH